MNELPLLIIAFIFLLFMKQDVDNLVKQNEEDRKRQDALFKLIDDYMDSNGYRRD